MIEVENAYATGDTSVKALSMRGYQYLTNIEKNDKIENMLYSNYWKQNTPRVAEAIVVLNMIEVIKIKGRHIVNGKVVISIDSRKVHQMIAQISTANYHIQDRAAEASTIRRFLS